MGPALLRIDDRLLHGQVTLGWATALGSKLIVVADDRAAADSVAAELFRDAAPQGLRVEVLPVGEAARRFDEFSRPELAAIVLVRTPADALKLVEGGAKVRAVNVGGLGFGPGKRKLLRYLYVGPDDEAALRRLIELGVTLEAQDVPGADRVAVGALL